MIRKLPQLFGGLILVVASYYTLRRPLVIWQPPWRSDAVRPAESSGQAPAEPADATEAVNQKAYGVLSTLVDKAKEVTGDTDTQSGKRPKLEVDRTDSSDALAPRRFLHRRFALKTSQGFAFHVPPHATRPRIHGIFAAFVGDSSSPSRRPENVEVLLLNEDQYAEFLHGRSQNATSVADPFTGAVIDWTLNSTLHEPLKYYLIFRNASSGRRTEQVDADFTVSFN